MEDSVYFLVHFKYKPLQIDISIFEQETFLFSYICDIFYYTETYNFAKGLSWLHQDPCQIYIEHKRLWLSSYIYIILLFKTNLVVSSNLKKNNFLGLGEGR